MDIPTLTAYFTTYGGIAIFIYQDYMQIAMPKNCRVTFAVNTDDAGLWAEEHASSYQTTSCGIIYLFMLCVVALGGIRTRGCGCQNHCTR